MRYLISATLIITGIIHLLPLSGVMGAERLSALYGTAFSDPNLVILMRHRAVLFGLLGLFFITTVFKPAWQPLAFTAGFISVVSFLWLAWSADGYNAQLGRVVIADVVAFVCLVVGSLAYYHISRRT
jgi:hypothetical protein